VRLLHSPKTDISLLAAQQSTSNQFLLAYRTEDMGGATKIKCLAEQQRTNKEFSWKKLNFV